MLLHHVATKWTAWETLSASGEPSGSCSITWRHKETDSSFGLTSSFLPRSWETLTLWPCFTMETAIWQPSQRGNTWKHPLLWPLNRHLFVWGIHMRYIVCFLLQSHYLLMFLLYKNISTFVFVSVYDAWEVPVSSPPPPFFFNWKFYSGF